ncbi:MAG: peptidyl-prolyl cis-trans isomerase [Planctomycetota bacterium]|nr:MAG: peptidyl-prolyl cis-trans isomerase [Planctomycetota bacterium]
MTLWMSLMLTMAGASSLALPQEDPMPQVETQEEPKTDPVKPASPGEGLLAVIVTNKGNLWITLFPEQAPVTVANFVNLAQRGYYDGVTFHRVEPNFVIQGGDPTGTGRGGPGYQFEDEFDALLRHDSPGILSMANAGPGTNGSQFFVTHRATPHLDDRHSVFGKVIEGQDVVNEIAKGDAMIGVMILGNAEKLLGQQSQNVERWNKMLDRKYPARESAIPEDQRKEIESQASRMQAKAAQVRSQLEKAARDRKQAEEKQAADFGKKLEQVRAKGTTSDSGLVFWDEKVGDGASPNPSGQVTIHYTGWLEDGYKFDSSRDGEPMTHRSTGFVPGFNEGLATMKVGGKRWLIIPGPLGYPRGVPQAKIPAGATLVFEIELLEVH